MNCRTMEEKKWEKLRSNSECSGKGGGDRPAHTEWEWWDLPAGEWTVKLWSCDALCEALSSECRGMWGPRQRTDLSLFRSSHGSLAHAIPCVPFASSGFHMLVPTREFHSGSSSQAFLFSGSGAHPFSPIPPISTNFKVFWDADMGEGMHPDSHPAGAPKRPWGWTTSTSWESGSLRWKKQLSFPMLRGPRFLDSF